jgi:hypothetical protein
MVSKLRSTGGQDSDRPHFYSQFWIDVAMGKSSPSLPEAATVEVDEDGLEPELLEVAPKPEPKAKATKPAEKKPEARPTITSLADLANIDMLMKSSAAMEDDEAPDISAGLSAAPNPDVTFDMDANTVSASDIADEEEAFDEEEEDDEWGGGRRKPKPGKTKRHERRDY